MRGPNSYVEPDEPGAWCPWCESELSDRRRATLKRHLQDHHGRKLLSEYVYVEDRTEGYPYPAQASIDFTA